jgi:hypothetical protein
MAYDADAPSPMVVACRLNQDGLAGLQTTASRTPKPELSRQPNRRGMAVTKGTSMSNPWLKKNPFMSMWLSGANSVANRARGRIAAEAKRQSTTAVNKATREAFTFWTDALMGTPAPKRRRKKR